MSVVASALFARALLPVPCMEKDSNHRSGEGSQENHQENKSESIREKELSIRRETGDDAYFTGIVKENKIIKLD